MFPVYPQMQVLPQPAVVQYPQLQLHPAIPLQQALISVSQPHSTPIPHPQQQHLLNPQPHPPHLLDHKTVYILSYSSSTIKHTPTAKSHLLSHLPANIPALLTIYCQTWRAPPEETCRLYSGVSPQIQRFVLQSRTAMREIKAIAMIIEHLNAGHREASVQTSCHAGTHRSVAAAEIVARELRGRGVGVVVRHLHRRRGIRDAW